MGDRDMSPAELLEPYAKRLVRAFIDAHQVDTRLLDAFWSLIYGGGKVAIDHQTALDVEHELLTCDKRVGDVLAGWRPAALSWTKPGVDV